MTPQEERKEISRFFLSQDAFGQPSRQGENSVGEAFARIMNRYGMPSPEPADQNRITGWRHVYNCMRQAHLAGNNVDPERAQQGPALFVSADCPAAISCIPMAVRDDDDLNDVMRVPGVLWEDVTDMLRYGLKSMLDPKIQAPTAVRAKELYDSLEHVDMTGKAIEMQKFQIAERAKTMISRPRARR
jgi:hypothetical protein